MKTPTFFPLTAFFALSAVFLLFAPACDEGAGAGSGEDQGYTGDVGDDCTGLCNHSEWCADVNLPLCVSNHCVGPSIDKMYCTQLCNTQADCPDRYVCTTNCNLDESDQPYCVKQKDYDYLFGMGICGPAF